MNEYTAGSTSLVEVVDLMDSASTVGAGKTGLAYNTASLTCYYKRSNGSASVPVTLVNITTLGTFVSGGFKEIDSTNQPGSYEFHPPNAAFASGAKWVTFYFVGAAGMVRRAIKCRILAVDPDDGVRGGQSALPNVASGGGAGSLPVIGTSTNNFKSDSAARMDLGAIAGDATAATNAKNFWNGNVVAGTAQAGSSTTITLASGASANNNQYTKMVCAIVSGAGAGQTPREITGYVGATKVATVDSAWTVNPDNTSVYQLIGRIV